MTSEQEPQFELLERAGERVCDLVAAEERMRVLLDAMLAIGGELDLHATRQRIVPAWMPRHSLTDSI